MTNIQSVVFGATGIVGGYIVEHLVQSGQTPIAVSRSRRESPGVRWIQGDLSRPPSVKLPTVTTIYCTVEVGLLADCIPHLHTPALTRIIAFTSTSIATKIDSDIDSERELLRRLAEGEQRLVANCERLGIGWTILRPTIIYAEGRDGNVTRLARLIDKFKCLPLMGNGSGLRQPVHAEDLAIGAIQAASSHAAINKTYVLPGGEMISYREMVGRIFDALDRPRRIVSTPPLLWKIAFALAKPLFPGANVAMGSRMSKDMIFDASPAMQDLQWKPRQFRPRFVRPI